MLSTQQAAVSDRPPFSKGELQGGVSVVESVLGDNRPKTPLGSPLCKGDGFRAMTRFIHSPRGTAVSEKPSGGCRTSGSRICQDNPQGPRPLPLFLRGTCSPPAGFWLTPDFDGVVPRSARTLTSRSQRRPKTAFAWKAASVKSRDRVPGIPNRLHPALDRCFTMKPGVA